ncbi:hypothetical protein EYF80_013544 [Liparis tanakae]|uniref:Uncharacterized protein n=1 Tax=Liparis tanakae TaxID=230148 RepID=A0A4Z2IEB0_9TELE|nr:hypothetical protein EYF80_013544 [Liparis tanakae]
MGSAAIIKSPMWIPPRRWERLCEFLFLQLPRCTVCVKLQQVGPGARPYRHISGTCDCVQSGRSCRCLQCCLHKHRHGEESTGGRSG